MKTRAVFFVFVVAGCFVSYGENASDFIPYGEMAARAIVVKAQSIATRKSLFQDSEQRFWKKWIASDLEALEFDKESIFGERTKVNRLLQIMGSKDSGEAMTICEAAFPAVVQQLPASSRGDVFEVIVHICDNVNESFAMNDVSGRSFKDVLVRFGAPDRIQRAEEFGVKFSTNRPTVVLCYDRLGKDLFLSREGGVIGVADSK